MSPEVGLNPERDLRKIQIITTMASFFNNEHKCLFYLLILVLFIIFVTVFDQLNILL